MGYAFLSCSALPTLSVLNWDVGNVTDMGYMFYNCAALQILDVSNWDTSKVTNMGSMFQKCTSLKTLDVSKWNTSSVTNMRSMFSMNNYGNNPPPLSVLDVSNWDVSNVTDMGWMFYGVGNLKMIDVSKWDVSKVVIFHHMCAHSRNLVVNGYENWKLDSCKHLNAIFHSTARSDWDMSNWDVSGVETFSQMFENSKAVTIRGLNKWDTSSGKSFCEMFSGCQYLEELDLSNFDTSNADDAYVDPLNGDTNCGMYNMFGQKFYNEDGSLNTSNYMCRLQKITLGSKFNFKGNGNKEAPDKLKTMEVLPNSGIENEPFIV
jgi:surface protein